MESQMDVLREYKNGYFLRVAALSVAGAVEPLKVRRGLSDLADAIVEALVPCAQASLTAKVRDQVASIREQLMFGVVGYGKLGGRELSYNSDLDLVFLFDCEPPADPGMDAVLGYYHSRVAQRIIHMLNTTTRAGVLYETDIRLRPSGRSGTMVSSVKAFREYQLQQAWTWEHQALVRSRMIAGPPDLVERFESVRTAVLMQPRNTEELTREVAEMRRKMSQANDRSTDSVFDIKLGEGGLVDIEFMVQYHVLANAREHPEIIAPRGTVEILAALADAGLMDAEESRLLESAYREYLARELELKLEELEPLIDAGELTEAREYVSKCWGRLFGAA
jgi:glutamate-ammonia-ligase adenylyltransferase